MSSGGGVNDGSATETPLLHKNGGAGRGGCGLDILKSVVYGGLLECIRSLSVISSAACSGSSTLSVLGLGVAMMVSDLIIFAKNLTNLKKGTDVNPEEEEVDPYEELLGSRQNYGLHSTVSIISFCLFGLIPPLAYFFLFSETDDKTLKLISAFMASLLCIILLALLEVCARNRPESFLDTVVNYANLAIKSSAVYHLVRNLVPDLLKNEDTQQPQSKPDVSVPPTKKLFTEHGTSDTGTEASTHRGRRRRRKVRKAAKKKKMLPDERSVEHEGDESDEQDVAVESSSPCIRITDLDILNSQADHHSVHREDDNRKNNQRSSEESSDGKHAIIEVLEGGTEWDVEEVVAIQETHDLYCPNCSSCITKRVIFRKRNPLDSPKPSTIIIVPDSGEQGGIEWDVEKMVAVQETHDLYCPNCNSCITRKVILRKRKRQRVSDSAKSNHPRYDPPEEAYWAEPESDRHEESDVFRCLSCFSFFIPTGNGFKLFGARREEAGTETRDETGNYKPEIDVEKGTEPILVSDQQVEYVETATEPIQNPNHRVEGICVEIIKSVVFGGLAECITSLGVVSCAAGSGASTRNIMALGIANLLTGLTVIAYSLQELRKEDREERIQKLLGRRQNFRLLAVTSILSLLLFGLVPPLFCVAFDDRNHEILSAFAASLFCILLLAIGKVWVQKPPKSYVKSVLFYGSAAVGLSGISFSIGYLIGESLKLIGWLEPDQAGTLLSVL